ncbi:MAG: transporter substrate-binding domain-containing protein [Bacteriovoracaceae bacterium]|nr:transporter substrate-binding domain-containing protein [Bacteriovoracaceae bacterium]
MKTKLYKVVIIYFIVLVCIPSFACEITLGFKLKPKRPFIGGAQDNSGVYKDLYSLAASKISCKLSIKRFPKMRIYRMMKHGEVDFYPGMKFNLKRAKFAYFAVNGIYYSKTGLTLNKFTRDITSLDQLKGLRTAIPLGGINIYQNKKIDVFKINQLDIKRATVMLLNNRIDFYSDDTSVLDVFFKYNEEMRGNLKLHPNCCGGKKPYHLGFAMGSKHFKASVNQSFNKSYSVSINNFPVVVDPQSIAFKFMEAVKQLSDDGTVDRLYAKYVGEM